MNPQPSETSKLDALTRPDHGRRRAPLKTLLPILGIPAVLILLLFLLFRERLTPAVPVQTERVILLEQTGPEAAHSTAQAQDMQFQASGWVEPDPWPVRAAVQTDGFVEAILVKEGETVTRGQELARLDPADARLALEAAQLKHRTAAIALEQQDSTAAMIQARLDRASALRQRAHALEEEARDNWTRIEGLAGQDTSPTERIQAEQQWRQHLAEHRAAAADLREAEAMLEEQQHTRRMQALEVQQAANRVATAQLALDRTVIHAPMNGVVLRRFVEPGGKRMAGMDDPNSATIVTLYDPARLQVRVDVPLAEAGRLQVGQATRIYTALLAGEGLTGTVTRIVGEADLQRNTLQAKVAIHDPDARLRPEILCRVEFWHVPGDPNTDRPTDGSGGSRDLWVPITALEDPDADRTTVWVVDPNQQRVEQQEVQLGRETRDGRRRVRQGLRANQPVVVSGRDGLRPDARVRPLEKDTQP